MEDVLLTPEVAKVLRVSEEYVRELIRRKKIRAYQEGRRGGYRILKEDVERYIKGKFEADESGAMKVNNEMANTVRPELAV